MALDLITRVSVSSPLLIQAQHPIENLQSKRANTSSRAKFDLAFGAHSSKAVQPGCTLAVNIASCCPSDLLQTHAHPISRGAKASAGTSFFTSFASNRMHRFRAQMFGMPVPESNKCCGDFVRVRLVGHNYDRGAGGPFAYQGEL
jgi:hypothetical protein